MKTFRKFILDQCNTIEFQLYLAKNSASTNTEIKEAIDEAVIEINDLCDDLKYAFMRLAHAIAESDPEWIADALDDIALSLQDN